MRRESGSASARNVEELSSEYVHHQSINEVILVVAVVVAVFEIIYLLFNNTHK